MKILILMLLLLCSCGSCGSLDNLSPVKAITSKTAHVAYGSVPDDKIGYTYYRGNFHSDIYIREGLLGYTKRNLIIHEMFHVLGYIGHLKIDQCYFSYSLAPILEEFCEEDKDLLYQVNIDEPVKVTSSIELQYETQFAIEKINSVKPLLVWQGTK